MNSLNINNSIFTEPQIKRYSKIFISDILTQQKTIKVPRDIVTSTWLKFHPSLGKPDEVVWYYGLVQDEFEHKRIMQIPFLVNIKDKR
jgi:hypothetical protein